MLLPSFCPDTGAPKMTGDAKLLIRRKNVKIDSVYFASNDFAENAKVVAAAG